MAVQNKVSSLLQKKGTQLIFINLAMVESCRNTSVRLLTFYYVISLAQYDVVVTSPDCIPISFDVRSPSGNESFHER